MTSLLRLTPLLLAACMVDAPPPPVTATLPTAQSVRLLAGALDPVHADTVFAGVVRLEYHANAQDGGHNIVLYRLPDGADRAALFRAIDTLASTPPGLRALGGPEGVDGSSVPDVTLHLLEPGNYLIGCAMRGDSGHRHLTEGEWQQLVVLPAVEGTPPAAVATTIDVDLGDFAFVTQDEWPSGQQLLAVHNTGKQDHLMLIERLYPGKTLADYIAAEDTVVVSDPLGGVSRMGPGEMVYYPMVLVPGTYVLTCLIVDPATQSLHVEMGMIRTVVVK